MKKFLHPFDRALNQLAGRTANGVSAIRSVGHYVLARQSEEMVFVSGQLPRVKGGMLFPGRVGAAITTEQAGMAAEVCALRVLKAVQQELGSLGRIAAILRLNVNVRCTEDFGGLREVADAASGPLLHVLGSVGHHSRTTVGVFHLPDNACVELDAVLRCAA